MPFLRVIRDKRGYETTYLMHWYREGGRQRSRILYVFRTPGGVQVGRSALDPDVLRQLEVQHPDIAFDWKAVRENQQVVEPPPPDLRRQRKPRRGEGEGKPEEPAAASPRPAPPPRAAAPSPQSPARPAVPSAIAGATPEEQVAFLAEWYPQLRDRIPQRSADTVRQETLLALAERLNPAAWTDADQVTAGLVQAAEALERLSHVFAKRRRRPRRPASSTAPGSDSPRPDPPSPAVPDPSSSSDQ